MKKIKHPYHSHKSKNAWDLIKIYRQHIYARSCQHNLNNIYPDHLKCTHTDDEQAFKVDRFGEETAAEFSASTPPVL